MADEPRKDLSPDAVPIPGAPDWVGSEGGLGPSTGKRWATHKYDHRRSCWTELGSTLVITGNHAGRAPLAVVRWVLS